MNKMLLLAALLVVATLRSAQAQTDENGKSYFVVIGAFSSEKYTTDFISDWAKKFGLNAQYKLNTSRKLFYVFTMQDKYWGIPVQEAERIRKLDHKLDQTWVFYGTLDDIAAPVAETKQPITEVQPTTQDATTTVEIVPPVEEKVVETVAEAPATDGSKKFFFRLEAEDSTVLKAPIEMIDLDNSDLEALYPSNEVIAIKPLNSSGRVMVQSKVFGYRMKQIGIDFNQPTDSAGITESGGVYTVPMTLKPIEAGDVSIMYNVFFFKDAAVMRTDSKYEINSLVAMMQAHPNRKIIIHGHTNGNYRGKIIMMNEKKSFFSMSETKSEMGSATKLSEERAKCIQEYLVANGVDRGRMEIKAWGGKKMLYEHDHKRAIENVRVEIEIVKD